MKQIRSKVRWRSLVLLVTIVLLFFSLVLPKEFSANETVADLDIQAYVSEMQPGWNLGNTFDAVGDDETAWGNPRVTKELIEQIAEEGYKSIRIPVTWENQMGDAPDYTIDGDFFDRVEQVVNWSLEEDLYVMINLHHDSWLWIYDMENNYDEVLVQYNSLWQQISERFKNHSEKLMFESVNEPRFNHDWGNEEEIHHELLDELNTSFYDIVRESGGLNDIRPLVLPTLETATSQNLLDNLYETMKDLDDPNLIATVHYYGFWPFSVNVAGYTRFEEDTRADIIDTFDRVHDTFVSNGIPVVLGEYGLLGFDTSTDVIQQGEKLKFFEYLIHYLNEKSITHMLWDNGQHLNRSSYEWYDQEFFNMMQASWEGRSSTAESNLIHVRSGEATEDKEVQLNLHGNEWIGLYADGEELQAGQDYQRDGELLTVSAGLITELTSSGELGTNAVLTASFNQGVDWNFNIVSYDDPILENAEGTTDDFTIPTTFNGNSLATMEAVYDNGDFAGPQNWTSYKEFGYTFSPSYDSDEISLTQQFFNEVEDREVLLTFHFWSGETAEYTILKNGDNVTGRSKVDNELPEEEEDIPPPDDDTNTREDEYVDAPAEENNETSDNNDSSNQDDKNEEENSSQSKEEDETAGAGKGSGSDYNLPSTATNAFNFLLLGGLFTLTGIVLFLRFRNNKLQKTMSI